MKKLFAYFVNVAILSVAVASIVVLLKAPTFFGIIFFSLAAVWALVKFLAVFTVVIDLVFIAVQFFWKRKGA